MGLAARFTQSVAFSPSGKRVACGSMDGNVAVFDVESKQLLRELEARRRLPARLMSSIALCSAQRGAVFSSARVECPTLGPEAVSRPLTRRHRRA